MNRIDSIILYALPPVWLGVRAWRRGDERLQSLLMAFAVPVVAWLVFATLYYGFPLPNPYYAKVATGIPAPVMYRQGLAYLLNSFSHDPMTLATIGVGLALTIRMPAPLRLVSLSALLYVVYTVSVGGDFMSGRFFATAFVVGLIVTLRTLAGGEYHLPATAVLVLYNLLMPLAPVKTTTDYDAGWPWRSQNGIKDERGHYHRITNVFFYSPFRELPDHTWVREGRSFLNRERLVLAQEREGDVIPERFIHQPSSSVGGLLYRSSIVS